MWHIRLMTIYKEWKNNAYVPTCDECEIKLIEMIQRVKAEITEEKAKKGAQ